jgi:hypothetical protein
MKFFGLKVLGRENNRFHAKARCNENFGTVKVKVQAILGWEKRLWQL